ncbi:hypothetical protein T484DRAFT_1814387 [Baffinella frigidus]|nr:hypothetical protein T484DRAFT_1814387 [Cryptophyta sp. CCMP2293]
MARFLRKRFTLEKKLATLSLKVVDLEKKEADANQGDQADLDDDGASSDEDDDDEKKEADANQGDQADLDDDGASSDEDDDDEKKEADANQGDQADLDDDGASSDEDDDDEESVASPVKTKKGAARASDGKLATHLRLQREAELRSLDKTKEVLDKLLEKEPTAADRPFDEPLNRTEIEERQRSTKRAPGDPIYLPMFSDQVNP